MIFVNERYQNKLRKRLREREYQIGFCDLLGYVSLYDANTVIHQDGAVTSFFEIESPDFDSSTEQERIHQAAIWQRALSFLDDGWMIELNVQSKPLKVAGAAAYGEPVAAMIAKERQKQFSAGEYYTSSTVLSLTYKSDDIIQTKLKKFIVSEAHQEDGLDDWIAAYQRKVQTILDFLSQSTRIEPLTDDQTISFLHQCITGSQDNLTAPYKGGFLHLYLATEDFYGGYYPKIGDKHIRVLSIDELPEFSYPGILDCIHDFAISYRWSSRYIALGAQTSNAYLKRSAKNWSSKAIGVMGTIRESMNLPVKLDEAAQAKVEEIEVARYENNAGINQFGFYTATIVLMDEDKAKCDRAVEAIIKRIQQRNYKVRSEFLNTEDAYLGSLPGHGGYNLRKRLVDSRYVSHAIPISTRYQGNVKAPCPYYPDDSNALLLTATHGARPFYLNLHVGDVGHSAILGPTGSGKSTLIAALIAAHRQYEGSRIVVLDKDRSNECIIKALNGSYFSLEENDCQLAPLGQLSESNSLAHKQATQWLTETFELMGVEMTPMKQTYLNEALSRMQLEAPEFKKLRNLTVQDKDLRQVLDNLNSGPFASLLNGTEHSFDQQDVLGFDLSHLIQLDSVGKDYNIPIIRALFNGIENLFQDKRPTLLVLEEAWLYLKHPLFVNKLSDWFKTLRKANVSVLFVSQDLSDIVQSNAASVIQNSCPTRIFLPNPSAQEPFVANLYESFGLNERQIQIIKESVPKQDYYYCSPLGKRLFELDLGPIAKSFFCISKAEDIRMFHEIIQRNQDEWVKSWLDYKGVNHV